MYFIYLKSFEIYVHTITNENLTLIPTTGIYIFCYKKTKFIVFRRTCFMVLALRVEPVSLNAYLTNYLLLDTTRQIFQVSLFFRSTLSLSGSVKFAKK